MVRTEYRWTGHLDGPKNVPSQMRMPDAIFIQLKYYRHVIHARPLLS